MACVRIEDENTEDFDVKKRLCQGCILSPTLFNITIDYNEPRHWGQRRVSSRWKNSKERRICCWCSSTGRDFDDSSCTNYLNQSDKFGFKLTFFPKTEIMAVTRKFWPLQEAAMNNNNVEVVDNFVYLGNQLCNVGESEADVKRRMTLAGVAFHSLWKKVFKRREISLAIKLWLQYSMQRLSLKKKITTF